MENCWLTDATDWVSSVCARFWLSICSKFRDCSLAAVSSPTLSCLSLINCTPVCTSLRISPICLSFPSMTPRLFPTDSFKSSMEFSSLRVLVSNWDNRALTPSIVCIRLSVYFFTVLSISETKDALKDALRDV